MVVGKYWNEVVEDVEVFDVLIVGMDFLDRNAEDGGRFWLESQLLHLREAVDALRCADFEGFFGGCPGVGGGEFKSADDVGMTEHNDVGCRGDLLTGEDFWFTKKMGNKVEGMNVEVGQGITLRIVASEIVEIVTDKMLFAQMLLKDLHGRSITFLQANHSNG